MENIQVGLYTQVSKNGVKYLYGNYNFLNLFKLHFTIFSNAQYKKEKKNNKIPDMRMLVKLERIGANESKINPLQSIMDEVFENQTFEEVEIENDDIPFEDNIKKNTKDKEKATAQ